MSEPKPAENVIAYKRDAGRVTVHGWRRQRWAEGTFDVVTDCDRTPEWQFRSWMWLEFRTLNPDRVVLCKSCWKEGS